jgi:hypothetical protein
MPKRRPDEGDRARERLLGLLAYDGHTAALEPSVVEPVVILASEPEGDRCFQASAAKHELPRHRLRQAGDMERQTTIGGPQRAATLEHSRRECGR